MGRGFFPDRHSNHHTCVSSFLSRLEALYGLRIPRKTVSPADAPSCFSAVSHPSELLRWPRHLCSCISCDGSYRLALLAFCHADRYRGDHLYNLGGHAGGDLDRYAAVSRSLWGYCGDRGFCHCRGSWGIDGDLATGFRRREDRFLASRTRPYSSHYDLEWTAGRREPQPCHDGDGPDFGAALPDSAFVEGQPASALAQTLGHVSAGCVVLL